jgi:hypothetical protein
MRSNRVPCELYTLYADNGDPLLLYGADANGYLMLWPTPFICRHPIAFGRWCRREVERYRGYRVLIQLHALKPEVERWARWLGVTLEEGLARI